MRAGSVLIAGIALVATWLPFLPLAFGEDTVLFNAITADVHYYARMARFFLEIGFFSFDGQTVSNGFMPFWQLITTGLDTTHISGETPDILLVKMFVASLVFTGLGLAGCAWFLARQIGVLPALIVVPLMIPGGVYWITGLLAQLGALSANQYVLSIWSFANGMESGLGLAFFALWLPVAAKLLSPETATPRVALLAGLLSFAIFMARLDDVFLGVALFLGLLASSAPNRIELARSFALVPILGSAVYVAANVIWADSPLPVSGLGKTSLFGLPNGLFELSQIGGNPNIESRLMPLVLPALVGLLTFLLAGARGRLRGNLWVVLAAYVLMKAGFLFSSVPIVHQGHWYYAVMIVATNLVLAMAIGTLLTRVKAMAPAAVLTLASAVVVGAAMLSISRDLRQPDENAHTSVVSALCARDSAVRPVLEEALRAELTAGIIDTGDGAYAYCLDAPALTVTGLGDSSATLQAMSEEGFARFATARGYDLVVGSDVPFASYNWRALTDDMRIEDVVESGPVRIWRIVPE